jgi:hypothetical protein
VVPQWNTIPRPDTRPRLEQPTIHQEGRLCALQNDIKYEAVRQQGKLANEQAIIEAKLINLHQRESVLEASQVVTIDCVEW